MRNVFLEFTDGHILCGIQGKIPSVNQAGREAVLYVGRRKTFQFCGLTFLKILSCSAEPSAILTFIVFLLARNNLFSKEFEP